MKFFLSYSKHWFMVQTDTGRMIDIGFVHSDGTIRSCNFQYTDEQVHMLYWEWLLGEL